MELLLSALLTCPDARWLIEGARTVEGLTRAQRSEIILEIMVNTEDSCDFSVETDRTK